MTMGMEIRRATPSDVHALGRLSDRVFRASVEPGTLMPKEFPLLFDASNADNLYYVAAADEPVSLVGMFPSAVMIPGAAISVASMGSVCTLEPYRKRHYASAIIGQVIRDYSPHTSVLLVSGDLPIYRNVGCVYFGDWLRAEVLPSHTEVSDETTSHVDGLSDVQALFALYSAEPMHFRRSLAEMEVLLTALRAPGYRASQHGVAPRIFVKRSAEATVAYVIAMPSESTSGSVDVLEWAGSRTAIPELVGLACQYFGGTRARMHVALSDTTLIDWMKTHQVSTERIPNQGTIRVLNPELLLLETKHWIRQTVGADLSITSLGEATWQISWSPRQGQALPESHGRVFQGYGELSEWFFGADGLHLPLPRTDDLNYV